MKGKFKYYSLLLLVPIAFAGWYFYSKSDKKPVNYLAYFGPKNYGQSKDTAYHTVSAFRFTDQNGSEVTEKTFNNKIYVTEYFFTTCKSICPVMNDHLQKIYQEFKNEPSLMFLSHTVDPETDSVAVLKNYADAHGVNDDRWKFVTGSKQDLYSMARKSYLLNAEEGNGGEEDFIHTQNFALIDKEKHIRGFYDGTDSLEMIRLRQDIKKLIAEYEYRSTHTP